LSKDSLENFVESLASDPHFQKLGAEPTAGALSLGGIPPQTLEAIWAFIATGGGFVILKFTKQGVEAADQVLELIRVKKKGKPMPLRLVCPDGKTQFDITVREKEKEKEIRRLLKLCQKKTEPKRTRKRVSLP
jgi:hypothetical protein